jgi:hypothetical protein
VPLGLWPGVVLQHFQGKLLALSPDDRLHVFEEPDGTASAVGERIAALVDGRRTVRDICAVLITEFAVDRPTCERDTEAFVRLLVDRKVLRPLSP